MTREGSRSQPEIEVVRGGSIRRIHFSATGSQPQHVPASKWTDHLSGEERPLPSLDQKDEVWEPTREDDVWEEVAGEPDLETVSYGEPTRHDPTPDAHPADVLVHRHHTPKHQAPIDEIHYEIDHLASLRAGHGLTGAPADRTDLRAPKTVYETERGRIVDDDSPYGPGSDRALYLEGKSTLSRQRFRSEMVDPIIKGVRLESEEVIEETYTEYVPASQAQGSSTKTVAVEKKTRKKPKNAKKPKAKANKAKSTKAKKAKPAKVGKDEKKAAREAAKAERLALKEAAKKASAGKASKAEKDLQPQCAAVTEAGVQCRNSARHTSKYCGSHKGYHPKAAASMSEILDTAPAVRKAEDTAPATKSEKEADTRPQCAALTAAGKQCRNSARDRSKYCGSHKGYRPTPAVKEALDTAPRVRGAADTKPAVRVFRRKK